MAWYDWNQNLDIHVDEMNNEHKVLIELMNRLHSEATAGSDKLTLQEIFQQLVNYTRKHFTDEERYMDSISFPEAATHKLIHENLLNQLDHHFESFKKGDGTVAKEIFDFLKMWLNAHIRGIDIKYGEHSRSLKKRA